MSCKSCIRFASILVLPLPLLLSACGGGGGMTHVADVPPPPATPTPTPTPTASSVTSFEVETSWLNSPATRAGDHDLIALANSHSATPGAFRLEISNADGGFAYKLDAPSGFLPGSLTSVTLPVPTESWDFNPGGPNYRYENPYGDYVQQFGQKLREYDVYSDGTKELREDYDYVRASFQNSGIQLPTGQVISESMVFDAGLSYVAMGEWSWGSVIDGDGTATSTGPGSSIYFAYGDRTPPSGIPASGTAAYDAHTLGQLPFTLIADFGQRSISTEIIQASLFDVSGNAPFSNDGSFDIPLTGNAGSQPASGMLNGAFFGPNAEQVGGTLSVQRDGDQVPLYQDAFVGQQHH